MKTAATQATFAVFLVVATLAGGSCVNVVEHADFTDTYFGNICSSRVENDTFDGKTANAICIDYAVLMSIGARCKNDTTTLIIQTGKYMLTDGLRLRVALDGVETSYWWWEMSTSNEALFIEPAILRIKEMLGHSRLEVRIIERDGDTHNADIDISRFDEAIKPVRELCGW